MSSLIHMVLDLLRLASPLNARSPVIAAPLEDMLRAALRGALGQQNDALADALVVPDTLCHIQTTATVAAICRAVEQIEAHLEDDPARETSYVATAQTINDALMLALVAQTSLPAHTTLVLNDAAVFDYLATLVVEPQADEPAVVLVGHVPPSLSQLPIKVAGRQLQLRKTQIIYNKEDIYPHLDVWLPSTCARADLQINRLNWIQSNVPEARLELYTHNLRPFGQIYTAPVPLPFCIKGAHMNLTIPLEAGITLLATYILDDTERVLAQIVKVLP